MKILELEIEGLKVVELDVFEDSRGRFFETYNLGRYREAGIDCAFVQDNISVSQRGVLRGMHLQAGASAQAKLVSVLSGSVIDTVVDMRRGSATFGRFVMVELSGGSGRQLFIPRGFAHGFLALEDGTMFSYKCDSPYNKAAERGFRFDDPDVGIKWPNIGTDFTMSPKDLALGSFREAAADA